MEFKNFESTAISNIKVNDNIATVTFKGSGKSYEYEVNDVANFVNSLQKVIEKEQSVGKFINKAIKEDQTLKILAIV
jgi:transcription elongation factor Elf1